MTQARYPFAMTRIRKIAGLLFFSLTVAVVTCLLCEGLSSTIFVAREAVTGRPLAERLHTEYDELLGWINTPSLYIEDMYGPGIYVRTNSQSFRNNYDLSARVPDDKVRLICSGDSFTFGYGVDNDHTWCQLLASLDNRLETVNMGQGGYGIDQAYLWYKRDGTELEHEVHIFTFITDDFNRMQSDTFLGYGKPVLELEEGVIVTRNVPVPRRSFAAPWLIHGLRTLNGLKSIRLSQELFYRSNPVSNVNHQSRDLVIKIIEELQQLHQARNSILVLVYLPIEQDYTETESDSWRLFLAEHAAKNGWLYVDLVDEFRKLPSQEIRELFISEDAVDYYGASGHYTEEGNAFVAESLYKKLMTIPEISAKLQR